MPRSTTIPHQPIHHQVALRSWPTEPYGKGNHFKWSPDDKFVAIGKSRFLRDPQVAEQVTYK